MDSTILLLGDIETRDRRTAVRAMRHYLEQHGRENYSALLGALCEGPSEGVVPKSADEVWVTKDERRIRIGDMAPEHVSHTLALIIRVAREGAMWKINDKEALRCVRLREKPIYA